METVSTTTEACCPSPDTELILRKVIERLLSNPKFIETVTAVAPKGLQVEKEEETYEELVTEFTSLAKLDHIKEQLLALQGESRSQLHTWMLTQESHLAFGIECIRALYFPRTKLFDKALHHPLWTSLFSLFAIPDSQVMCGAIVTQIQKDIVPKKDTYNDVIEAIGQEGILTVSTKLSLEKLLTDGVSKEMQPHLDAIVTYYRTLPRPVTLPMIHIVALTGQPTGVRLGMPVRHVSEKFTLTETYSDPCKMQCSASSAQHLVKTDGTTFGPTKLLTTYTLWMMLLLVSLDLLGMSNMTIHTVIAVLIAFPVSFTSYLELSYSNGSAIVQMAVGPIFAISWSVWICVLIMGLLSPVTLILSLVCSLIGSMAVITSML